MLQKQEKRKNRRLHMFLQPAILIKMARGFGQLFFLVTVEETYEEQFNILTGLKFPFFRYSFFLNNGLAEAIFTPSEKEMFFDIFIVFIYKVTVNNICRKN